jgi:hypothetical protein
MSFFDVDIAELEAMEPVFFPAKTPVAFTILSAKEMPKYGNIVLTCTIDSGEYAGRQYQMNIRGGEQASDKRRKTSFMFALWSKEELRTRTASLDTLVGTKFQARPDAVYESPKTGGKFQSFDGFMKLAPAVVDTTTPF